MKMKKWKEKLLELVVIFMFGFIPVSIIYWLEYPKASLNNFLYLFVFTILVYAFFSLWIKLMLFILDKVKGGKSEKMVPKVQHNN
jgi:membrane protein YdbS with pleckstrin-like domain